MHNRKISGFRGRVLRLEALELRQMLDAGSILITEFMASNDTTRADFAGDYPDWIELHNPSSAPVDLAGFILTDNATDLDRWQFPAAPVSVLDPGEYLVVFASAKADAPDVPATELHTNFKLDADGEYLALVMPDAATIVQQFAPEYPRQLADISYGAGGATAVPDSLIGAGAGATILVPADGSLGTQWTGGNEPFDDSGWQAGAIGVGYEMGAQGSAHLLSVTNNNSLDANDVYQLSPGDLADGQLVNIDRSHQFANLPPALQGLDYILAANDDKAAGPGFSIDVTFDAGAPLYLSIDSRVGDDDRSDGPTLGDGVMDWVLTQRWADTGLTWNKANESGTPFHVYSLMPTGTSHRFFEQNDGGGRNTYCIAGGTSQAGDLYEGLISTDLEAAMFDQNGSAYIRIPFQVADPSEFTSASLDIHYDDGFVAYLNGVEIAARNAPAEPQFDSVATASQPLEQALVPETIDVSDYLDSLVAGPNVLAIHALNSSPVSSGFLILPGLTASRTVDSPASYYTTPTPGAANVPGALGLVADTHFSVDRGFFDAPFQVEVTTSTAGSEIRYTLDGSIPTATTGQVYSGPIDINATAILRAAAYKPGYIATDADTQTYLFLDDVLQQSASYGKDGSGLPSYAGWGHADPDWEVDPAITGAADLDNRLTASDLRSVPTMSLVLPWNDMFGSGGQGIYISGSGSPRGASIEQILEDGSTGFQIDGSVQIQGGTSDNRWKSDKLSMRVKFTEAFGPTKLNSPLFGDAAANQFDTFILDATLNHGWTHPSSGQTDTAKFIQDQFVADIQNGMGGYAPHARYHHLYINGLYWGMYYVHERPDESFAKSYLGGDKEDYDVLKHTSGTVVNGSSSNYSAMLNLARQNLASDTNFQNLAAVLDIDNLIDYMLANFYAGNEDWDHHNWYASYNRVEAGGRWRFHSWDAEHVLESTSRNVTGENTSGAPSEIHQRLTANVEYRQMFADHVQRHFFHGGVLTPESTAATYQRLMDEIDRAIVGESARWGDNRVSSPYTRDDWLDIQNGRLDDYVPQRSSIVVNQLRDRGLFPPASASAPEFEINAAPLHGGRIESGDLLGFSAPAGTVYFTIDGTDPRETGGLPAATAEAFSAPVPIGDTTLVRARLRTAGGQWSPLNEAWFLVHDPAEAGSVAVTEMNYHPYAPTPEELATDPGLGRGDFEFIELTNHGSEAIDLTGVALTRGIQFDFTDGAVQTLAAGERLVVVKNQVAFEIRYGTEPIVAGSYTGSLDDNGERIQLTAANGDLIEELTYNDSGAWPGRADGTGSTLERIDSGSDPDEAETWRSSSEYGGSPAAAGTGPLFDVIINEVLTHSDGAIEDWIELLNRSGSPIDVSGWMLSESSGDLQQYALPPGTTIEAGQYLVVTELQLGFALDGQQGDDVWLMEVDTASGRLRRFADHWGFDATATDVSLGRWPSGEPAGTVFPMVVQTLGAANSGPLTGDIIVSEVHYNPTWYRQEFSDSSADGITPILGGWNVVDGRFEVVPTGGGDTLAVVSNLATLPEEFKVQVTFSVVSGVNVSANGAVLFDYQGPDNFKYAALNAGGDRWQIGRRDGTGWHDLAEAAEKIAEGKDYDVVVQVTGSVARLIVGGVEKVRFDFGTPLADGQVGIGSKQGGASFDRVRVGPLDEGANEFVELYNAAAETVDLGGWKIRGGVKLKFDSGTSLELGETLVLVGIDPTNAAAADAFRARFGVDAAVQLAGPVIGSLRNSGEEVRLLRPEDPSLPETGFVLADQVDYDDSPPWPTDADGMGQSLTRTAVGAFAGLPASWIAADPTPGEVAFALLGDVNRDGEINGLDVDPFVDRLLGGAYQVEADMNGDEMVNGLDADPFVRAILQGAAQARSVAALGSRSWSDRTAATGRRATLRQQWGMLRRRDATLREGRERLAERGGTSR